MRTRTLGALLATTLLIAGCGGDEEAPTAGPTSPARTATAAAPDGLQLSDAGESVVRGRLKGNRLVAKVTVAGRAPAGTRVRVRSRCDNAECSRTVTASSDDGSFSVRVRAESSVSARSSFIDVVAGNERSTILLTFRAPTRRPAVDRPREQPKPEPAPRDLPDPTEEEVPALDPDLEVPEQAQTIPAPSTSNGLPKIMHVVGDSLAVGTEPLLGAMLPKWNVTSDAMKNRTLAEGMARGSGNEPSVLAYSLFTNDAPSSTAALEKAVRESLKRVPPSGCVIWATIVRPAMGGQGYEQANAVLRRLGSRLKGRVLIADWAGAVAANPSWVGDDGVHGTPAGYAGRAELYAAAARKCIS